MYLFQSAPTLCALTINSFATRVIRTRTEYVQQGGWCKGKYIIGTSCWCRLARTRGRPPVWVCVRMHHCGVFVTTGNDDDILLHVYTRDKEKEETANHNRRCPYGYITSLGPQNGNFTTGTIKIATRPSGYKCHLNRPYPLSCRRCRCQKAARLPAYQLDQSNQYSQPRSK